MVACPIMYVLYLLRQFSSEVAIRVRIRANIVRALSMHGANIKKRFWIEQEKKGEKMACRELFILECRRDDGPTGTSLSRGLPRH